MTKPHPPTASAAPACAVVPQLRAPHPRGRVLAAGAMALLMLAGACSSSDDETAPTVATLPTEAPADAPASSAADTEPGDDTPVNPEDVSDEDAEAAQLRFDQCMADQGVDQEELFGDAAGDSGDDNQATAIKIDDESFNFEAYEAALEECEPILEAFFGDFTLSPEQEAMASDAQAQFSQCMSDQGIDIDSGGDAGGTVSFEISEDEFDQDAMNAAFEECDKVFEELNTSLNGEEG